MAQTKQVANRTEPAYSLLYEPKALAQVSTNIDTQYLLSQVNKSLTDPFNEQQSIAFERSFTQRLSLLWGPPGTGKTTVLAGIVLGWLEMAALNHKPVCIGIGSSNYNAMDNLLLEVSRLISLHNRQLGEFPFEIDLIRLRSDAAQPLINDEIVDMTRSSNKAADLASEMNSPTKCLIVSGTWMQLSKLAEVYSSEKIPVAKWFDLLVIDEASQVKVTSAASYFLLAKDTINVVIAGDHKQLGPIYGFQPEDSNAGLFDCLFTYMQDSKFIEPTALEMNYRTNIEITNWPRGRFYSQGYESFYPQRRLNLTLPVEKEQPDNWPATLPWSEILFQILDPTRPIVVITYNAQGYTLSNPFEAQIVTAISILYRKLLQQQKPDLNDKNLWSKYLGIVTPHRAQMSTIRNLLLETAELPRNPSPFVDTVDRFQGQERDLIIASYTVADKDFVLSEEEFILNARRFNVTLTRARSKFIMLVSNSIVQHLPADRQVATDAAHLQLFVENYCSQYESISLPFTDNNILKDINCQLRFTKL